jgi:hypothetical protein
MRGYNLSSRPAGVDHYDIDKLAGDVRDLVHERGAESALLVGHDWGGSVAWATAMEHPEIVDRLAILNAAHPRKLLQGLHHPDQLRRSWYFFFFFALPDLPEAVVHANNWHFFRHFLHDASPAYPAQEMNRYIEAWSQPGAASGMINYYRSSVRTPAKEAEAAIHPIKAPTLVIWGNAMPTSSKNWPSPNTTTFRIWNGSCGSRMRRTGFITTRRFKSLSCSPISSRQPHPSEQPFSRHQEDDLTPPVHASRPQLSKFGTRARRARALQMLELVHLRFAVDKYPCELSRGMRQGSPWPGLWRSTLSCC